MAPAWRLIFNPRRGINLTLSDEISNKALGSDFNYQLITLDGARFFPAPHNSTLGLHLKFGTSTGAIPTNKLYIFSDQELRGYSNPFYGTDILLGQAALRVPLTPDRKSLLHDAAVVGKVFWPGAVASIGGSDPGSVRQGLRELVRKELVRPARTSSVENEEEFSFWHLLVRDVAYGQIPRAGRAEKHRAAAEWIERIAGERVADHAELLAEHYREALALARAAGADEAESLEPQAARFLVLAGDRSFHLDYPKAARYYAEALPLLPEGSRDHATLLRKLTEVVFQTHGGSHEEAERLCRRAVAGFRGLDENAGAADALALLSRILWSAGETHQSLRRLSTRRSSSSRVSRPAPSSSRSTTTLREPR